MNGYRNFAGWLLLGLLSGYLIFNRSFAQLGFPPLYIGEIVIAICLIPAIANWREAFLLPLKNSWIFHFIAAFMVFGLLRVVWDARTHGIMAARDGVICSYAIVAFIAPFVLRERSKRIVLILFPVSLAALVFVAAFQFHWIDTARWPSIKPDFLSVAAAVAFWNFFAMAFFAVPLRQPFILPMIASLVLIYLLPTRALWLAPPVLVTLWIIFMFSIAGNRDWKVVKFVLLLVIAGGAQLIFYFSFFAPASTQERAQSLFSSAQSYQTPEGQLGAASIQWRKIFWRTAIDETLHQSPALGLGFGTNLTDLLRDKPEWPIFEESQRLNPPNRHPHSAHVTVFARLGFAGLAMWILILAFTAAEAIRNCRATISGRNPPPSGSEFHEGARESTRRFANQVLIFGVWLTYLLAMTFGVVLENPFGGMWFWAMTGLVASEAAGLKYSSPPRSDINDDDPGEEDREEEQKRLAEKSVNM